MKFIFSDNSLWSLLQFRGIVIKHLRDLGHNVILVAPYEEISDKMFIEGVTYEYVNLDRTNKSLKGEFDYVINLYSIFSKHKPDFVFHYTIKPSLYASLFSKFFRFKSVAVLPGTGELFRGTSFKHKLCRRFLNFGFKTFDKIILLNEEDKFVLKENINISEKNILILPCGEGVDIQKYQVSKNYKPSENLRFLMIGRVLKDKGYYEFLYASKKIRSVCPNADFSILGFFDKTHPLSVSEADFTNHRNQGIINYLGVVEDVRDIISHFDCIVLPSFYNEGMNRSLMEAISMGKPIITTDNKGCREMVIDDLNGYIVKPRDENSLFHAILKFSKLSKDEILEMGRNSRQLAEEKFSDQQVVSVYEKLINEIYK